MNDYLIRFALLRERVFRELNNRELFRQLLLCTELTGNYPDSRELYEEILDRHPYCGYAWYNLGWVYLSMEAPDEALDAFEYAYITMPSYEEAYRAFAELAFQQGLYRRVLQCYAEMSAYAAADSEMLVRTGACHFRLGENDLAKKYCRRALQLDPLNAEAYYQLGVCFAAENDYRAAARWMREAIRTEDDREEFHSALALVYKYLGQSKKALGHYWRAVEIAPEESAFWLQLVEFLILAGDTRQAMEVLEQALEHAPGAELLYCRAACHFLSGDRTAALHTLRQALETDASGQSSLYRWAPALREDAEISGLLSNFK